MEIVFWIIIFSGTFLAMEGMSWFTHKYIMHCILCSLHNDHQRKDHSHWWEYSETLKIATQKEFVALIKCITSIWKKKTGNVLGCCWYHLNILKNN